jgi:hypothetical protein
LGEYGSTPALHEFILVNGTAARVVRVVFGFDFAVENAVLLL